MPTFSATKTTIQLSVADLGRTTTLNSRTQQSASLSTSIQNVAQEFARGSKDGTLTETPLYTEDGSHIRFLGTPGNMPFFMVHAGKNFFELNTEEKRDRRPARVPFAGSNEGGSASTAVDPRKGEKIGVGTSKGANVEPNPKYKPPFVPHALCLTVFLSKSSFEDKAIHQSEVNDVEIDVYFNGVLCDSHFVPHRYSGEAYTMTEKTVRFTGCRIGRLIEKPWVIVPSGQNPSGGLREYRRGKVAYAGAQQRWNDISDAIMAEADKIGHDEKGNRPVLGEYLQSLAQLSMPKEVEDMQKAGSPKFGVLDVVVLWGQGNKNGADTPYLVKPTSIRNEGFTASNLDQSMDCVPVQKVPRLTDSPYRMPQSRSEAIVNAKVMDGRSDTLPWSLTPSQITASNTNIHPSTSFPLYESPYPPLPLETPVKRSRGQYYDILTTKQTLCEEMDSIVTAAGFGPKVGYSPSFSASARTTRASYAPTTDSSPLSSAPASGDHTPAQMKIVKNEMPAPTGFPTGRGVRNTPRAAGEIPTSIRERSPTPSSKRRESVSTRPSAEALDRDFVTPMLSADCSITYAPSGIVRNLGAARGGVFRERGVNMGARFLIGG